MASNLTIHSNHFENFSNPSREEGFSAATYLVIAMAVAALAMTIFLVSPYAALAFTPIVCWSLWSAGIIALNRVAEGTCIEKPTHRLHAFSMEVNSAIAAAALFPATFFNCYHKPQGNPEGRPILMVNGYLSFGSTWHYQRQKLVEAGLGPIYTMNIGSGNSIKTYAEQVGKKIEEMKQETGRNDVALICHSKGGLVGSYYATHLAAEANTNVTDVITIGSPLAGTSMAYLGLGKDAAEMRPDSDFHQELRDKIKEHPEIRFSHIGSETDTIVPISSAILEQNPERQLILKDMGHLGLIFSSRVADQMCAWLET
jgi:pimeloyl-ACP methyl ester carboxylesterase